MRWAVDNVTVVVWFFKCLTLAISSVTYWAIVLRLIDCCVVCDYVAVVNDVC